MSHLPQVPPQRAITLPLTSVILCSTPTGSGSMSPSTIEITSQLFEHPLQVQVTELKCISFVSQPLNFVGLFVYWWFSIARYAAPIAPNDLSLQRFFKCFYHAFICCNAPLKSYCREKFFSERKV